jgi:hypothetical protein
MIHRVSSQIHQYENFMLTVNGLDSFMTQSSLTCFIESSSFKTAKIFLLEYLRLRNENHRNIFHQM